MSDSVWPHRQKPTRLLRPWDSPGKNTGVGGHFLLQCMKVKVKSESEVTQSCPTLSDPMDYSPSGSSAHGIFQARVLEWGAIALSSIEPYSNINVSLTQLRRKVVIFRASWSHEMKNISLTYVSVYCCKEVWQDDEYKHFQEWKYIRIQNWEERNRTIYSKRKGNNK